MNIIKYANKGIVDQINKYTINVNENYRLMKYCVVNDVEQGKIIMNHLTRAVVFIKHSEFEQIYAHPEYDYVDYLRRNYFLVPESFDEQTITDELREVFRPKMTETYLDHPHEFTILTTTTCNANCFYCYEKGRTKAPMSADTAEKVADYIIKVHPKDREVILRWFGGEPLFNMKVINIISQKLKDNNIKFICTMISNGYLFGDKVIEKAVNLWNLKSVQITLDGTEEVYNKAKNYIYKKGSPYQRVLNNIQLLLDNNIYVSIRMNLDMYNADNLKELTKELYERFGNNKYLGLYCYPLFEDSENPRTEEQLCELFKKVSEVDETFKQYGYLKGGKISNMIRATHCMTDTGGGVVIATDGNIGLCEHYSESEFFSHIDNPKEKDWENIKSWRDYQKPLDICADCPIYPSCIRIKKCSDLGSCNIYLKARRVKLAQVDNLELYKQYINNRKSQNSCENCGNTQPNQIPSSSVEQPQTIISKIKNFFKKF